MTNLIEQLAPVLNRVEISESSDLFQGFEFGRENSHSVVTHLPDGTKKVVNSCSANYDLMKNEDVLIPMVGMLERNFSDIQVATKTYDDKRFFVDFHGKPNRPMEVGEIYPAIRFQSSYDGFIKWGVSVGLYRVWCDNQCANLVGESFNVNIKHKKSVGGNSAVNLDEILESIENSIIQFPEVVKRKEILESIPMTEISKTIPEGFEQILNGIAYPKRQVESAIEIAKKETKDLKVGKMSLWLAYQGLNYILNHDSEMKMAEHLRRNLDQNLITNVNQIAMAV